VDPDVDQYVDADSHFVAVVVPCYRVSRQILDLLSRIGPECSSIFVVDDACPEGSGRIVETRCRDPRVKVIYHAQNLGVGGAVMTGYRAALGIGARVIVKLDGDGQMDPRLLGHFVAPILAGEADYTKGNRFYDLRNLGDMPPLRIFGNALLSFLAKLSTGYWNVFDPTNGYTAVHASVIGRLPLERISARYFFETDMLFRLNTIRAVVRDIPMDARYGDEESSLRISRVSGEFLVKHLRNFAKRVFYSYFLRDFSIASLELCAGSALALFGILFGSYQWAISVQQDRVATTGTVMLAALPLLVGVQYLLAFLSFDTRSMPSEPIHPRIAAPDPGRAQGI
jgi:glycosyltransferase involved in cell wall biosynthesis